MEQNKQYRAAIYARYSSAGQRDESIEGQIRECREFAARNNITVVKIYADRAVSGTTTAKRDEFNQMIKDSEKGIFDAVICWKLDRFARNRYDSALNKARLKKNGCRIFYARESIPEGADGIILESVLEGFAEYYSANLSENVKRGNYESALDCKTLGVKLFGYRKAPDGKYEIDPETAPAVRYVFEQYAEGTAPSDIVQELNSRGYRTLRGGLFNKNSVAQMVRNEKYAGVYIYKDLIRVENGIPALVDRETFDKCQKRLAENRRSPKSRAGCAVGKYILTGKLFCGKCGSTMISGTGTSKTGRKYGYYQCSNAQHHKCDKRRVKKDWIETLILNKLRELVCNDEFIALVADKAIAYQDGAMAAQRKTVTSELERRRKESIKARDNIIRAIESGMISDALRERYKALDEEIISLEAAIKDYVHEYPKFTKEQIIGFFRCFRNTLIDDTENTERLNEQLLDTFLNSAFLYDDGRLVICFNYSGPGNKITITELEKAIDDFFETPDCRDSSGVGESSSDSLFSLQDRDNTNSTIIFIGMVVAMIVQTK